MSYNILQQLAAEARDRVAKAKEKRSFEEVKQEAETRPADTGFPFYKALAADGISFICEVKKASPSKGIIAEEFPYLEIAKSYEEAGASAISCLTEPAHFLGSDAYLEAITESVSIPVLRKDFTVDAYQIYEAKLLGASAVLLICAILTEEEIREYLAVAHNLGLDALVEAHDGKEVEMAKRAGANIIGVNNRDLRDFSVDIHNSVKLREQIGDGVLYVSESGIRTAEDVATLYHNGTDAVLIGELLMRAPDKKVKLEELKQACRLEAFIHDEN